MKQFALREDQHCLDYTIVGKEVNAASRLENSATSDQIHISHSTYELVKDAIPCRGVGELRVKGLAYPIRTYEIITPDNDEMSEAEYAAATSLGIDFSKLEPEQIDAARRAVRETLAELGGSD